MITSMYEVKLVRGLQDSVSDTVPDADFDQSAGYYVGYRLLVNDGVSWVCSDASLGAAVWVVDASDDSQIKDMIRAATEWICRYCDDYFNDSYNDYGSSGISFDVDGSIYDTNAGFLRFFIGDTIKINGSLRNDGWYDVTLVTDSEMFVDPYFNVIGETEPTIYFFASDFPIDLQKIAARIVAYDMWDRKDNGLSSESIGTYSYTRSDITESGYPHDIVTGLMAHKRPRIR